VVGLSFIATALGSLPPATGTVRADDDLAVDLIVDLGDGRVRFKRASLPAGSTGADALMASDLDVVGADGMVCAIDGVGCPASDCFCACPGGDDCRYWSYHHGTGEDRSRWEASETGASGYSLTGGDVEGWAWGGGRAPITTTSALRSALAGVGWLRDQQQPDGGMGAPGLTVEAVLAATSMGGEGNASDWNASGRTLLDHLAAHADGYSDESAAAAGKLVTGIAAAGVGLDGFAGLDLLDRLAGHRAPDPPVAAMSSRSSTGGDRARAEAHTAVTGGYGDFTWNNSWAILGGTWAGSDVRLELPQAAADLVAGQSPSGGWGGTLPADSDDTDSTALAVQAIAAVAPALPAESKGAAEAAIGRGLQALADAQRPDGGWGFMADAPSNVNSTAYALQAIAAVGADPRTGEWLSPVGPSGATSDPVTFLLGTQQADGRFQASESEHPLLATLQAVPALAGRPLADADRPGLAIARGRAAKWIASQRQTDGLYPGFGLGATLDAALALGALGAPTDPPPPAGGRNTAAALAAEAGDYAARGSSAAGKLVTGAVALGIDPHDIGGTDAVAAILAGHDPATGVFGGGTTWDLSWAVLGLVAADHEVPDGALPALLAAASPDGGWGFDALSDADVDSTGLALQALLAGGLPREHPGVLRGIDALRGMQAGDGAFTGFGAESNPASAALAIGALVAAGHAPDGLGWSRPVGPGGLQRWQSPLEALVRLQGDSGAYAGFSGPEDPGATYTAALGLAARRLPIRPHPAIYLPHAMRGW